MRRSIVLATVVLLLLGGLALSACGNGAETPAPSTSTPPSTETPATATTVEIREFAFSPAELEIGAGETVEWTNADTVAHTVSGDGWDSGQLSQGQTFSRVFDTAGTYAYSCSLHPAMKGTVTVK